MDLRDLINDIAKVADTAATVLPQAAIAGGAARIGGKILDIIEDLHQHAPSTEDAATLEAAHDKLVQATTVKSGDLSRRLRG
jgi:hypothetical protein